jgi:hypothetical protein
MDSSFLIPVLLFIGGWAGYFVRPYLAKKGENLATHEDIDKLVKQVQAVTQATKEIENKISNDFWERQKRWELKKEVLFEAARRLSEIDDSLFSLNVFLQQDKIQENPESLGWAEAKHERFLRWSKASAAFDETKLFVNIVCEKTTSDAFEDLGVMANQIAGKISQKDLEYYANSQKELWKALLKARLAVRKELGIDGPATSRGNLGTEI